MSDTIVAATTDYKAIMLSNFCVDCPTDSVDDTRARYVYDGNSLCVPHFLERKDIKEHTGTYGV